jgi:hypothetical protein
VDRAEREKKNKQDKIIDQDRIQDEQDRIQDLQKRIEDTQEDTG